MDALLCFGVCLAIYTALVSGLTCLAIGCLLRQHRKALLGSFGFQPPLRPELSCQGLAAQGSNPGGKPFQS